MVHTSDFIDDASRTNFVGFEAMDHSSNTYTEDGVTVTQVIPGILHQCGSVCISGSTGRQWYPSGGDHGWTEISRAGGGQFADVGFLLGSGWGATVPVNVAYELLSGGARVLFGTFVASSTYLGFAGGGFDTIRVAASTDTPLSYFGDGTHQAAAIDNIELSGSFAPIPVPAALPMLLLGIAGLGTVARRRRRA